MKRERDNSLVDDDEIRPPRDASNRNFRISSESSSSNIGTTSNNNNSYDNNNNTGNNKEQDRFLPIANVGRIMKKVIPGNGKISKDAKETVQECVSEFISFVTCEASDKCQREKRKTINGDDILWAIMTLGFEDYATPLKVYLNKYREVEGEKLNVPKQQQQQQSSVDQQQNNTNNNSNLGGYNNVYSSGNIMNQGSFMSSDPMTFPALNFPQGPIHGGRLPQQDQLDDHW